MLLVSVPLVRTDHENSVPEYHETLKRTSLLCIAGRILLCTYRRSTRYTVDRLRACLYLIFCGENRAKRLAFLPLSLATAS
jgi:hypothetical protein